MAVGIGVLLALALGLLVVQGIFAPVFTRFFGLERAGPGSPPARLARLRRRLLLLLRGDGRQLQGSLQASSCTEYWSSPWPSFSPSGSTWPWAKDSCPASMVPGPSCSRLVFLVVSARPPTSGRKRGQTLYAHNQKSQHGAVSSFGIASLAHALRLVSTLSASAPLVSTLGLNGLACQHGRALRSAPCQRSRLGRRDRTSNPTAKAAICLTC